MVLVSLGCYVGSIEAGWMARTHFTRPKDVATTLCSLNLKLYRYNWNLSSKIVLIVMLEGMLFHSLDDFN